MPSKRRPQARRARRSGAGKTAKKSAISKLAQSTRAGKPRSIPISPLSKRSQEARNRAFHVLAAMRRDSRLTLSHASRLQGVKLRTVTKYFPSALSKARGKFRVKKSDRFQVTLYLPDKQGNPVEIRTGSYEVRQQSGAFLRDLGRAARGKLNALSKWHGKKIAGVELVTDIKAIKAMEPGLSDFALYRAFNTGNA